MKKMYIILIVALMVISGCSRSQRYVGGGAAAGAAAGNLIGESTGSTIIGAGLGAAAGAIIEHQTK